MTEDRMPRLVIDAILIVRVVSNYQSAGAVFQKLRGKGQKGWPYCLPFSTLTSQFCLFNSPPTHP